MLLGIYGCARSLTKECSLQRKSIKSIEVLRRVFGSYFVVLAFDLRRTQLLADRQGQFGSRQEIGFHRHVVILGIKRSDF